MMTRLRHLSLVSLLAALSAPASADVTSTFDTSVDGWSITGDASGLAFSATGGNPGGRARGTDSVSGSSWHFVAPAKFLGNRFSAYGTNLTFDLSQEISGSPDPFNDSDVILVGAGLTLVFDTPNNPAYLPNWTSYSIPLTASAGWRVSTLAGAPATEAQMRTTLASLTALRIRGEYQTGADWGSLDNVRLVTAIPGDANRNGRIDPDDFTLTDRGAAKGLTGWSNGDFNGDNAVTPADYALLNSSFAAQSGPSPVVPLVPEPATLALAAPALLGRPRRTR